MVELQARDQDIPGGTLNWMWVNLKRSFRYDLLAFVLSIIATAPLLTGLMLAAVGFPDAPPVRVALVSYFTMIIFITIGVSGVLRDFRIIINLDEPTEFPGFRTKWLEERSTFSDNVALLLFLVIGYSMFGLAIIVISGVLASILPVAAVLIPPVFVLLDEWLIRNEHRSLLSISMKTAGRAYKTLTVTSTWERTRLDIIEKTAADFTAVMAKRPRDLRGIYT